MPEFLVTGVRNVTIDQRGDAWVEAETADEAKKIAEDDPDSLDWMWDDLDIDDASVDSIEIKSVEDSSERSEQETESDDQTEL